MALQVQRGQEHRQRKISKNVTNSFLREEPTRHDTKEVTACSTIKEDDRAREVSRELSHSFGHDSLRMANDSTSSFGRDNLTRRNSREVLSSVLHDGRSRKMSKDHAHGPDVVSRSRRGSIGHVRDSNRLEGKRSSLLHDYPIMETGANLRRGSKDEFMGLRAHTFVGKSSNRRSRAEKLGRRHKTSVGTFRGRPSFDYFQHRGNPEVCIYKMLQFRHFSQTHVWIYIYIGLRVPKKLM
jgi:hypothetical protein